MHLESTRKRKEILPLVICIKVMIINGAQAPVRDGILSSSCRTCLHVLAKGYKPFHISDYVYVHVECWKETLRTFEDFDDVYAGQYHHGRHIYFDYCKEHNIDASYIQNLQEIKIFVRQNAVSKTLKSNYQYRSMKR